MADKFLDKTGLAYFWEKIKAYFQSQHITPPEYTIVRLANEEVGYAASYVLKKDGTQVGATINIPKDYLVRSGEVKTVTVADEPYEGAVVGDKYLDFVVNTIDDSGNISHIYIPVSDLVDAYIAGNGIQISDNNYISVKVSQQGVDHGLGVGGDGLTVRMVTPSVNGVGGTHGAMYAADKEKLDNLEIVGVFTTGSDTEPPVEGNDGLVPAPTWAERLNFLRGDGTWVNPSADCKTLQTAVADPSASGTSIEFISGITQNENGEITPSKKTVRTMSASGQNHASGLVPDPGSTAGTTRYLCENGTWSEPNGGGGVSTPTDVQVNGTSITSNNVANVQTEGVYDPTTNKIATMSDVTGATPNVGHLKTDNSASLTPSASESFTGDISLHTVAKTGSYKDLNDKPTIPSSGDFVTSLGTSGNNVTWTKNGVTNNLTVPYASVAGKLGTSTVGATNKPIYLSSGTPTAVTSVGEAFLSWGGKNFSGGNGPLDAALISNLGANRFAFINPSSVTVEYSTDGGTTWLDYEATDAQKGAFFAAPIGNAFYLGKHSSAGSGTENDRLRITVDAYNPSTGSVYSTIKKFACYMSTNGAPNCKWAMQVRKTSDFLNNVDTWTDVFTDIGLAGWSDINIVNKSITIGSNGWNNTTNTQYRQFRFIFSQTGGSTSANYGSSCIYYISAFGGVGWSTPSNMAKYGSIYSYDYLQNAIFPAGILPQTNKSKDLGSTSRYWNNVYANKFIKSGGTSSQFLKADGSVDSNTYATTSQLPSLPLSIANGGTGATTKKAAEYAINGGMAAGSGEPSDNYQFVFSRVGSDQNATNGVFLYRTAATIWSWIKNKISSVLGIGGSNGVPTAPTAAAGTNTTQIATTAFVNSATSGFANDTDVVHKANAETITGEKTFNGGAMFGVGSQLKFETAQEEGTYIEAGDDNGVKTLMFADLEDDSSVRLENIATPVLGTDAANKAYVDSKGDNNLVKLNGRSGQYGVTPRSLCAFAVSTSAILEIIEPFSTTGGINGKPVRQGVAFPIGCKIYYHPDYNDISANTDFTSKEFYSTYDEVDARYTAVTGQNISLYSSSQSGVYLRVTVDNGYWSPYYKPNDTTEIIVTPHDFQNGNFYIYLGKTVGSTGYKFQLEDNNPLYYYDGTKLIDWATYQANASMPSYTAGDGISISNGVISCTPRPYKKEVFTAVSFNASSAYQKGWQNFVASSNLEVGTYKVTLQVHIYIVSNTDNMMPAGCVVNAYMRSKATASSEYQYILGATETFSGGVLPETSIPTGRGIISKVLNVVGFLEVTGYEDSNCSLEVGFTTNSSLNVMIGNPTPLDGSYYGYCSGNDFVLLEKIA